MATLTLGLPVYNAAPFVEDALRSIFAQSFREWELIAVDDGSSDGSPEILRRLKDGRVRVLVDGEHRGLGARLNQIVSQAAGAYIARMDADDLMHPQRLERQIAFLQEHPEIDVAGCGLISFDAQEQPISVRRLPAGHSEISAHPLHGFALAHASTVGRTGWWKKHAYNERNRGCEDWELWFDSHATSRFSNLAEPLYFYREEQAYGFRGYARDKAEHTALLWRRRRELGGPAVSEIMRQYARIGVYAAAHLLRCEGALIRRRGEEPSESEAQSFAEALQRIKGTALPV